MQQPAPHADAPKEAHEGVHGDTPQHALDAAAYLRANPAFLAENPGLYDHLTPPRRLHGPVLADHMDAMLRAARVRAAELERVAASVAADRRAAEGFGRRVQDVVLALMRATDPAWLAGHELAQLLRVDAARLCSEAATPPAWASPVPRGTIAAAMGQRLAIVRAAQPDALLHGEAVALASQEALVRIPLAAAPALLALACRDGAGLHGATTDALAFLGHALGAAIERA